MSALLLAALVTQAAVVQPASDSVEIEIAVTGTAEVPAQGYRLNAFLSRRVGASSEPVDTSGIVRSLEALEMPERETCLPFNPFGFIANDLAVFDEEDATTVADAADEAAERTAEENLEGAAAAARAAAAEAAEDAAVDWRSYSPVSYIGFFSSKASVERAQALLEGHEQRPAVLQPVLFDCSEATDQARLAALTASAVQVEPLARALGMRVVGVTRVASATEDQSLVLFSAMSQLTQNAARDTVKVQSALRVTYRLER